MIDGRLADDLEHLGKHLKDTPLAGYSRDDDLENMVPLRRAELFNIKLVFFLAQAMQVVVFSVLVFVFFVVFGVLSVDKEVMKSWLNQPDLARGELFHLALPVPNVLIQVAIFLCVFSGLYFVASAASDPNYRKSFFDPLIHELKVSLAAREVYLAHWGDAHDRSGAV